MVMQTCSAWLEDEDRSGAATGLAAIAGDMEITSGDNLQMRKPLDKIAMAYIWTEFAAYAPNNVVLSSPNVAGFPLRFTKGVALNYANIGQIYDWRDNPYDLIPAGDNITATGYEEDEAGVAHFLALVIIRSDGPIPKGPLPKITNIHRMTVAAATAATWSRPAQTDISELPSGKYLMYGARVEAATAVAARFVIPNLAYKPAVIPVTRAVDCVHPFSQFWGGGIEFTMPGGKPQLEILDTTTSTSEVELYLRKIA